jgi:hypothetical protein
MKEGPSRSYLAHKQIKTLRPDNSKSHGERELAGKNNVKQTEI